MPLLVVLGCGLLAGCDQPGSEAAKKPAATTNAAVRAPAEPASVAPSPTPKADEKDCFACKGTGLIKCRAPGCQDGWLECPGPCLKLNRGSWVHLDVAGHPPTDLWQKFYIGKKGGYSAFNQGHVGHVIVVQNDQAVDTGACKLCDGKGKVACSACKGTGTARCLICEGKKLIPVSWTPTNNPWLNRQPDLLRLTDGRILLGQVINRSGTNVTIKTRDGRWLEVSDKDLAPNTAGTATNQTRPELPK